MSSYSDPPDSDPTDPTIRLPVLVVHPDDSAAIEWVLGGRHALTFVNDGQSALALLLAGRRYVAIICETLLPDMTGDDLQRETERRTSDQGYRFVFTRGGKRVGDSSRSDLVEAVETIARRPIELEIDST